MKQQVKWALALLAAAGFQMTRADTATDVKWYDNLKLSGDMRYRFDEIQLQNSPNRERERIRARVGIFPTINEDVDVGIRLGTGMSVSGSPGEANPVSENQTLTDQDTQKAMYLDLGYIDYHPSSIIPGLDLIGGKMANPMILMDTYLWDPDTAPEGLAAKYRVGDDIQLLVNGTYQWLKERSTTDDSKLYAGQAALNFKPSKDSHIMAGGTYYDFANMKGFQVLDWQNNNNAMGNSTTKSISGTTTNLV